MNNELKSLKEKILERTQHNKPEFLEGRNSAEYLQLLDNIVTLKNFSFGNHSELGEFVTFIIEEDKENYYNQGGKVVVDTFKKIEEYREEIEQNGIPMKLTQIKGKNRRVYTKVEFYPET